VRSRRSRAAFAREPRHGAIRRQTRRHDLDPAFASRILERDAQNASVGASQSVWSRKGAGESGMEGRRDAPHERPDGAVTFEVGEVLVGGRSGVAVEDDDAEPASVR
jgi:hypothetical protein